MRSLDLRMFTPSVAMHIHTAWLAASRAVSGSAMQLTSAIHTKVTSSLIMRLSCGDTSSRSGEPHLLEYGAHQAFPQVIAVHGQDRDESRPTPRRALDVCAPDRRSTWTTRAGRCHCHGRRSGYSACTYKPDWCHPAVPVHARCSGLVGVCGRHRRAGQPARRWPRGKCASEQPRTGK